MIGYKVFFMEINDRLEIYCKKGPKSPNTKTYIVDTIKGTLKNRG